MEWTLFAFTLVVAVGLGSATPVPHNYTYTRVGEGGLWSQARCVGTPHKGDEEQTIEERLCHFRHLCFTPNPNSTVRATFYGGTAEERGNTPPIGRGDLDFYVYLYVSKQDANRSRRHKSRYPLRVWPEVVDSAVPPGSCLVNYPHGRTIAPMMTNRGGGNIGHTWYETYLPIFNGLQALGLLGHPLHFLPYGKGIRGISCCDNLRTEYKGTLLGQKKKWTDQTRAKCMRLGGLLPPALGAPSKPEPLIDQLRRAGAAGCPRLCFPDVVGGSGNLTPYPQDTDTIFGRLNLSSDWNVGRGGDIGAMRQYVRSTVGLPPLTGTALGKGERGCTATLNLLVPFSPSQTRLVKNWGNVPKLAKRVLAPALLPTGVCLNLTEADMRLQLRPQLSLLGSTSIIITQCGGSATFSAFFLPEGAHIIMFCNKNETLDNTHYSIMGHLGGHSFSTLSSRPGRRKARLFEYRIDEQGSEGVKDALLAAAYDLTRLLPLV